MWIRIATGFILSLINKKFVLTFFHSIMKWLTQITAGFSFNNRLWSVWISILNYHWKRRGSFLSNLSFSFERESFGYYFLWVYLVFCCFLDVSTSTYDLICLSSFSPRLIRRLKGWQKRWGHSVIADIDLRGLFQGVHTCYFTQHFWYYFNLIVKKLIISEDGYILS